MKQNCLYTRHLKIKFKKAQNDHVSMLMFSRYHANTVHISLLALNTKLSWGCCECRYFFAKYSRGWNFIQLIIVSVIRWFTSFYPENLLKLGIICNCYASQGCGMTLGYRRCTPGQVASLPQVWHILTTNNIHIRTKAKVNVNFTPKGVKLSAKGVKLVIQSVGSNPTLWANSANDCTTVPPKI